MAETQPSKLFSVSLTLLRFVLAAWIGAAILYVITSVAEQTSSNFDSVTRDQLATVRFPIYYKFGTGCHVISGILALMVFGTGRDRMRMRSVAIVALISFSAVVFAIDFFYVYSPLQDLIVPPGKARTQEFVRLHNLSRHINEAHLLLMLIAALIAAGPVFGNTVETATENE